MAFDEDLDARVASIALSWDTTRTKMFGGIAYLLHGNMMAGVIRDQLVIRLGADEGAAALKEPGVCPFDLTGRPPKGWVMIGSHDLSDDDLVLWLSKSRAFAETLPPK
jgi:TfoX/Sxy family transcriptional regulator of competence genes